MRGLSFSIYPSSSDFRAPNYSSRFASLSFFRPDFPCSDKTSVFRFPFGPFLLPLHLISPSDVAYDFASDSPRSLCRLLHLLSGHPIVRLMAPGPLYRRLHLQGRVMYNAAGALKKRDPPRGAEEGNVVKKETDMLIAGIIGICNIKIFGYEK